jgi:hypothetical protein
VRTPSTLVSTCTYGARRCLLSSPHRASDAHAPAMAAPTVAEPRHCIVAIDCCGHDGGVQLPLARANGIQYDASGWLRMVSHVSSLPAVVGKPSGTMCTCVASCRTAQAIKLVSPLRHYERVQQPIIDLAARVGIVRPGATPEGVQPNNETLPAALQATLDADAGLQRDAARLYYALRVIDDFEAHSLKVEAGHATQQISLAWAFRDMVRSQRAYC